MFHLSPKERLQQSAENPRLAAEPPLSGAVLELLLKPVHDRHRSAKRFLKFITRGLRDYDNGIGTFLQAAAWFLSVQRPENIQRFLSKLRVPGDNRLEERRDCGADGSVLGRLRQPG